MFKKKYKESLRNEIDYIRENANKSNFDFLCDNYNNINKQITDGVIDTKTVKVFVEKLNKLYFVVDNNDISFISGTLFFYNLYRLYGNEIFNLEEETINALIETYMLFEEEYDIHKLDGICDFIFEKKLEKRLLKCKEYDLKLKYYIIDIVDSYLKEGMSNNISERYYVDKTIKDISKYNPKQKKNIFGNVIYTPELIYTNLKEQIDIISCMTNENYSTSYWYDCLNKVLPVLKNINFDERNKLYEIIRKIDDREDRGAIDKINLILDFIVSYDNQINNKKNK